MTETFTPTIRLENLTFNVSELRQIVWDARGEIRSGAGGGSDAGQLLIRLDVDGEMDTVTADLGQTGDLVALDRAITALSKVRDGLDALYAGQNDPGRCMAQSDWGRCYGRHGHDEDHDFPTEAQGRASLAVSRPEAVA